MNNYSLTKKILVSLFAIPLFCVLVILFVDIILKSFSEKFLKIKSTKPVPFLISYNQHTDYLLRKNLDVVLQYRDTDRSRFITDEIGFRNRTVIQNSDFAFIGDSFTEADGVSQENMWTSVIGRETGKSVMNHGVLGFGAHQKFSTLKHYALPLKPKKDNRKYFKKSPCFPLK